MLIGTNNYVTNEVKGSFWRPDDYMAKVPNEHVVAAINMTDAADLSISEAGLKLAEGSTETARQDLAKQYESEDGVVRRYMYNINADQLSKVDVAV
ncbi:MAG: hypothetical protein K6G69_01390 [Lachnospiraceae bacterium]|nr:hypothetical protein [Lachnospiraceae bacterium]